MSKPEQYAPPELTPLPFLAFGKHPDRALGVAGTDTEDYDAQALLARFGSPLYVVSEQRLRRDYREFLHAFSEPFLETRIAYSVKTNYLPAVCAIVRDEGAWMEVVSGMEYELVRALDVPAGDIILNGPHKTRAELERAAGEGALINIDHFDELDAVEALAAGLDKRVSIGLRISFECGAGSWTKFGFSDDNGDAQRALERVAANPRLELKLLHHHAGTFILAYEIYAQAVERLVALAARARRLGLAPTMLDMGGGFPSQNTLKPEFDLPGGSARTGAFWFPYAETICTRLEEAKELFGNRPTLVLEPGRAIVDACTRLLCTVVAKKSIPGQGEAVIVDAGVNLVPTACYYDHEMALPPGAGDAHSRGVAPVDVYGPLCMQTDRLRTRAPLPPLEVGAPLVIANVGAYCHTQSAQFIRTRPATVLVGPDGPEVIRRAEAWRDLFALDSIPGRLRVPGCSL